MDQFSNLPNSVKWSLGGTAACGLIGAGFFIRSGIWIVLTIVILFLLIVGGFLFWQTRKRKKQSAAFDSQLKQQSATSPREISDPGKRAKLDDLKRKFEEGLVQYKSRGKDLYKLPWYLIVGEPGSGKTEAIRHCNVGFPPGLTEERQGAGGTVNMNWWFTNHGVLLDTAGRLMFEEIAPGESSEWQEFLKILKKVRQNCPINGLFLIIPADSLLKDSADQIEKKAGKIAQQLDVIQRVLDVRFPVYVLVTKCDLLIGFREFFDGITDPQLQHQMIGWSNPDPLDAPFRPELVDEYLERVALKLRKRRMGLLRDPVPENPSNSRIGEVDSMYALPHSITKTIAPRLRRYLEIIFIAGEWSAKPVFLRGMYFNSSMREGSALDAELAEAIGVPVTELPEGKGWERDRAFFLRDLFMDKVFREKGLVTRATSTKTMLRKRQVLLFGSGIAALLIWGVVAWFGMRQLRDSVGAQSTYWRTAMEGLEDPKVWSPIITRDPASTTKYHYHGGDIVTLVGSSKSESLVQFHTSLRELAKKRLKRSWVFRPIFWVLPQNLDRKNAQRVIFEQGVLWPILQGTWTKISSSEKEQLDDFQQDAFVTLLELEADVVQRQEGKKDGTIHNVDTAKNFLAPMIEYLTHQELDKELAQTMAWTYSADGGGDGAWPPNWFSAGKTLDENEPIDKGLANFLAHVALQTKSVDLVKNLRDVLSKFQIKETELGKSDFYVSAKNLRLAADLEAARKQVDEKLVECDRAGILKHNRFSAVVTYTNLVSELQASVNQLVQTIETRVKKIVPTEKSKQRKNENYQVFLDIQERLHSGRQKIEEGLKQGLSEEELSALAKLDEHYLANNGDDRHLYAVRAELYGRTYRFLHEDLGFPLVSSSQAKSINLRQMKDAKKELDGLRKELSPANLAHLPSVHRMTLKKISDRISPISSIADILIDDKGVPTSCSIGLDENQDRPTVFKYRGLDVFSGKSNGNKDTTTGQYVEYGIFGVDESIQLDLYSYRNDPPVKTRRFSSWGPVQLILTYQHRVNRSDDGKTWLLAYPVDENPGSGSINVKIVFDRQLPDLANWPRE